MSTKIESIDYKELEAAGGPVSYNKQIGYGSFFLTANIIVFGDNYDQVKITFANSAGQFQVEPIFLDPQNTTEKDLTLNSGLMTLKIASIQLTPPTPDTRGKVALSAEWTDLNGTGKKQFTGAIADWTNPPKA